MWNEWKQQKILCGKNFDDARVDAHLAGICGINPSHSEPCEWPRGAVMLRYFLAFFPFASRTGSATTTGWVSSLSHDDHPIDDLSYFSFSTARNSFSIRYRVSRWSRGSTYPVGLHDLASRAKYYLCYQLVESFQTERAIKIKFICLNEIWSNKSDVTLLRHLTVKHI